MNKPKIVSVSVISICVLLSMVIGFTTANSYKFLEEPLEASFFVPKKTVTVKNEQGEEEQIAVPITCSDGVYENVTLEETEEDLQLYDNIFLVTIKNNTNLYRETITTAHVDKVIKGDVSVLNTDIWIYEVPHFHYVKEGEYFTFFTAFDNNFMQPKSEYLIFVNEIDYVPEVDEILGKKMFTVEAEDEEGDILCRFNTFPLKKITFTPPENVEVYGDVAHMDWFCFTNEQAEVFENIRASIVDKYIGT